MPAPLTTPQARRRVGARDVDAIRVVRTQLLDRQSSMRLAYVLAWVSLSLSVAAFTGGMAVSFLSHSTSALGFALENAVDAAASALLLWRFWSGTPAHLLALREKRASIGMALGFVALAMLIGSISASHLLKRRTMQDTSLLIALAIPTIVTFLILGTAKLWVAQSVDSASLRKDALCSICGALLAFGVLAGCVVENHKPNVWWVDDLIAVVISCGLLISGLITLIKNACQRHRWWKLSFWLSASSGGADVMQKGGLYWVEATATPARDKFSSPHFTPDGTTTEFVVPMSPYPASPPPRVGSFCVAIGSGPLRVSTPSTTSTSSGESSTATEPDESSPIQQV